MKKIVDVMTKLNTLDDVRIVVGTATVCSDWHFDGWAVDLTGIWMWRKDLNRWFFKEENDRTWWMVLTDDEVTFEEV